MRNTNLVLVAGLGQVGTQHRSGVPVAGLAFVHALQAYVRMSVHMSVCTRCRHMSVHGLESAAVSAWPWTCGCLREHAHGHARLTCAAQEDTAGTEAAWVQPALAQPCRWHTAAAIQQHTAFFSVVLLSFFISVVVLCKVGHACGCLTVQERGGLSTCTGTLPGQAGGGPWRSCNTARRWGLESSCRRRPCTGLNKDKPVPWQACANAHVHSLGTEHFLFQQRAMMSVGHVQAHVAAMHLLAVGDREDAAAVYR